MDASPRKLAPKHRLRWHQFSVRTLLIGIALLSVPCAYVAHEARIVAARKQWLAWHPTVGGDAANPPAWSPSPDNSLPLIRRLLGDQQIDSLVVEASEKDEAATLFPEASVSVFVWFKPQWVK
jgi:hypothetical protein